MHVTRRVSSIRGKRYVKFTFQVASPSPFADYASDSSLIIRSHSHPSIIPSSWTSTNFGDASRWSKSCRSRHQCSNIHFIQYCRRIDRCLHQVNDQLALVRIGHSCVRIGKVKAGEKCVIKPARRMRGVGDVKSTSFDCVGPEWVCRLCV